MSAITRAAKLGTIVELRDGRVGTTVFNGLIGVGIKWGRHNPPLDIFEGTTGGVMDDRLSEKQEAALREWTPDALLRDALPGLEKRLGVPCVGEDFRLLRRGLHEMVNESWGEE